MAQVTTKKTVIHVSKIGLQTAEVFTAQNGENSGKIYIRLDYGKFHPQTGEKVSSIIGEFNSVEEANKIAEHLTN